MADMLRVVAAIAGRARVRGSELRSAAFAGEARALLEAVPGVVTLRANPRAASLVIEYAPDACSLDVLVAALQKLSPGMEAPPLPVSRSSTLQAHANRLAKHGAFVTLAVSLAFAAAGRTKLHAATGALALVLLAVHLGYHGAHTGAELTARIRAWLGIDGAGEGQLS